MKGQLIKTEKGWVVSYHYSVNKNDWETLPLHPKCGIPQDTMCDVLDNGFAEVEFEMVLCSFSKNKDDHYAKLIQKHQTFIDNRKDKLETLAKLLAKSWFYGEWKWESPNERVMQMLMQDLGLYPFKDEDEMIQQTKIDDGLDKDLYLEAKRRVPTYGKLSGELVENKLDLRKMEQKLDDALANETPESLTEWMNSKREDDVEKLADEHYTIKDRSTNGRKESFIIGYTKAKETLYTEEQVREAIIMASLSDTDFLIDRCDEIIKYIKQPKQ